MKTIIRNLALAIVLLSAFKHAIAQTNYAVRVPVANQLGTISGSDLNITTNTLTLEAWVRPENNPDWAGLLLFRNGSQAIGISLLSDMSIRINWNNASTLWNIPSTLKLEKNKWNHVAFVIKPDSAFGYINGQIAVKQGGSYVSTDLTPYTKVIGNDNCCIGRNYNGSYDDIRIWDVARTHAQIKASMYDVLNSSCGLLGRFQFNEASMPSVGSSFANSAQKCSDLTARTMQLTLSSTSITRSASNAPTPIYHSTSNGFWRHRATWNNNDVATSIGTPQSNSYVYINNDIIVDSVSVARTTWVTSTSKLILKSGSLSVVEGVTNNGIIANCNSVPFTFGSFTGNAVSVGGSPVPTTSATAVSATSVTAHTATLSWTNGNGNSRLVVVKPTTALSANALTNGTDYVANSSLINTTSSIVDGSAFVVYNGTGTSVNLTNMAENTTYNAYVFEYNDNGCGPAYKQTTPAQTTFTTTPSTNNVLNVAGARFLNINTNGTLGSLNTNSFTVEAWVYPNTASQNANSGLFMARRSSPVNAHGVLLGTNNELRAIANGAGFDSATGLFLTANRWNHIAVTFKSDSIVFILNNGPVRRIKVPIGTYNFNQFNFLQIGNDQGGGPNRLPNISIEELRVWNGQPSRSQLEQYRFNIIGPIANLIANFRFNGSNVLHGDYSASGSNWARLAGNLSYTAPGNTAPVPFTSSLSGNWDAEATWGANLRVPQFAFPNSDGASVQINSPVTLNSTVKIKDLTVNATRQLSIRANTNITITGGITNNGTITRCGGIVTNNGTFTGNAIVVNSVATVPTVAPSALVVSGVTSTTINISFTNGNGAKRLVVVKPNAPVNNANIPDGTAFNASNNYSSAPIVDTDGKVVMAGTISSFTVTNLIPSTSYYVAVYEYNENGCGPAYLKTPATANFSTPEPKNAYKVNQEAVIPAFQTGVSNNLTLECWVKPTATQSTNASPLMLRYPTGAVATGLLFGAGNQVRVMANGNYWDVSTGISISTNLWSHLAMIVRPDSVILVVNGTQIFKIGGTITANNLSSFANVRIGNDPCCGGRLFKGDIDAVRVWSTARTVAQIRNTMHTEKLAANTANLLAQFDMNMVSGNSIPNLVTNGQPATFGGTTPSFVASNAPVPYVATSNGIWKQATRWNFGQVATAIAIPRNSNQDVLIPGGIEVDTDTSKFRIGKLTVAELGRINVSTSTSAIYVHDTARNQGTITNCSGGIFSALGAFIGNPVSAPVSITTQPTNQTGCLGGTATFTVVATGATSYQWRKGTTNIPNATQATLTLNNLSASDAANNYNVVVTSSCGSVTSANRSLTISAGGAIITSQPTNQGVCIGGNATFTVATTGTVTNYQWKRGSTNVGTNSATLTINNVTAADTGSYTVTITSSCGSTVSSVVKLSLLPTTSVSTQPTAQTVCAGASASFSVVAAGAGLSYQWKKGTANVGTNAATLNLTNVSATDAANYSVVVTGTCGTATSNVVALTVNPTTAISTQPTTQTACAGSSASFSVVAAGTGLSYQWKKGTANVGTNAASLNLTNVSATDAANYSVVVTGTCGSATSNAVALQVTDLDTTITAQGDSLFAIEGTPGVTYKWKNCATNQIIGTTRRVKVPTSGNYKLVITKGSCSDSSACRNITVTSAALRTNKSDLAIYPNPTRELITIETGTDEPTQVMILDLSGRELIKHTVSNSQTINVSALTKGVYIIRVSLHIELENRKLIIE